MTTAVSPASDASLVPMIGLEIHVQLHTNTKLFCGCITRAAEPNSAVCPVCLGHPGAKPVLNRAAVEQALRLCAALDCDIASQFVFSRKTYFYPDLSKNFQITQFEFPMARGGAIVLDSGKTVRLRRIQLEEDPAALVHETNGTLVDYNRSGIPLVEIVTEPDMDSPSQAREFLNKLSNLLDFLGSFVAGEDTLKADCNVSIAGHVRVELKNVSGFWAVEKALQAEIERQRALLRQGEKIVSQTRGFDIKTQKTVLQREKESEADYGYIFEPDLVPTAVSNEWISRIRAQLPELPAQKAVRFSKSFGLSEYDARVLCSQKTLSDLFEFLASRVEPALAARFLTRELLGVLNYNKRSFADTQLDGIALASLLELQQSGHASEKNVKQALIAYVLEGVLPADFLAKQGLLSDVTDAQVQKIVAEVVAQNPKAVSELKTGNSKSLNFLVGLVMRKLSGKANARRIQELIEAQIR